MVFVEKNLRTRTSLSYIRVIYFDSGVGACNSWRSHALHGGRRSAARPVGPRRRVLPGENIMIRRSLNLIVKIYRPAPRKACYNGPCECNKNTKNVSPVCRRVGCVRYTHRKNTLLLADGNRPFGHPFPRATIIK